MPSRFCYSNKFLHSQWVVESLAAQIDRALFVWITTDPAQDPLVDALSRADLISFCTLRNVNIIFLDMYNYLGSSNYTPEHVAIIQSLIEDASSKGIVVYALAGNTDWSTPAVQSWVQTNITNKIIDYNNSSSNSQKFSGFLLDVEYWTDAGQTSQDGLTGLCDLIISMRNSLNLPVGCFAPFYFKDNTNTRTPVTYNATLKQEGAHLLDVASSVVVGAYRNTALYNPVDDVDGQIALLQPWYDYAVSNSGYIYMGSETIDVNPPYTTFFSKTNEYMESQLLLSTQVFNNSKFKGHAIHSYDGWKIMI